jgi:hypothetical protein
MKATIRIELEPGEETIPEAKAIQAMQHGLSNAARMTPDELAQIWQAAITEQQRTTEPKRQRHQHRRKATANT